MTRSDCAKELTTEKNKVGSTISLLSSNGTSTTNRFAVPRNNFSSFLAKSVPTSRTFIDTAKAKTKGFKLMKSCT